MQVVKCNSFVTLRSNCCPCFILVPCPSPHADGHNIPTDIVIPCCYWCRFRHLPLLSAYSGFQSRFVHFCARCLPKWGKHVAQHGQARCPTWAHFLFISCPKSSLFHDRVLHILLSWIRTRVTFISPSGETERGCSHQERSSTIPVGGIILILSIWVKVAHIAESQ